MRIPEIAALRGEQPYDTVYNLLIESSSSCNANFFTTCEEDVQAVIAYPRTMICTDGDIVGDTQFYHPRLRGSFPRALGRYVREFKTVSLPEMIRKMTSMPAAVYGLQGKGLLAPGHDADICIFDPDALHEEGTYRTPDRYASGMDAVLVMGEVALEKGTFTRKNTGRLIRR